MTFLELEFRVIEGYQISFYKALGLLQVNRFSLFIDSFLW